jgi:phosphoribosylanthranilate isomerase
MKTKLKFCGLTRRGDIDCAIACGADYLGFVLYPRSPRYVSPEQLAALVRGLPHSPRRVGVAVNADPILLREAIEAGGLHIIQFHGEETPEQLAAFHHAGAWKAIPLGAPRDLEIAAAFIHTDRLVVDAAGNAARGGTGQRCDWTLAAELARTRPVLLAGGLTPANVAGAIRLVQPDGVDVSSGVEEAPGYKNHEAMRAFAAAVRDAGKQLSPPTQHNTGDTP